LINEGFEFLDDIPSSDPGGKVQSIFVNDKAKEALDRLLEGNERFRTGRGSHYTYSPEIIERLATGQAPQAAVVACSDGRVTPEIVFDQPLTNLFVSRVPGNVASDSAKWMLEIAVTNLQVPLVVVMGHTRCLAIKQVIDGAEGAGGSLRDDVAKAVNEVRKREVEDLFLESVKRNAIQTVENLRNESSAVRQALQEGRISLAAGYYDVDTGQVHIVESE